MLKCGRRYSAVALVIVTSAILLFSCDSSKTADTSADEHLMTEYSEQLTLVVSQNGRRSYLFETPLLEGYTMAREPYREFRKGIKITTYQDDSLTTVDAVLTANYAIYYENRDLWEAKGNVVAQKPADGKTLYTQQLFWNARTRRVYSNVDSKMVENEGRNVYFGESFESDEEFKDWKLRRSNVRMEVEMKINETDSVRSDTTAAKPQKVQRPQSAQKPQSAARTNPRAGTSSAMGSKGRDGRYTRPSNAARNKAAAHDARRQRSRQQQSGQRTRPAGSSRTKVTDKAGTTTTTATQEVTKPTR